MKQKHPAPLRVALVLTDREALVRVYADNTRHGYFNVEAVPLRTGACIPGMRRKGRRHAKSLGVPFVEEDSQTQQTRQGNGGGHR